MEQDTFESDFSVPINDELEKAVQNSGKREVLGDIMMKLLQSNVESSLFAEKHTYYASCKHVMQKCPNTPLRGAQEIALQTLILFGTQVWVKVSYDSTGALLPLDKWLHKCLFDMADTPLIEQVLWLKPYLVPENAQFLYDWSKKFEVESNMTAMYQHWASNPPPIVQINAIQTAMASYVTEK